MSGAAEIVVSDGRLRLNPRWRRDLGWDRRMDARLPRAACERAAAAIAGWQGYAASPQVGLPGLARELGLGRFEAKYEGGRFGIGSFKALGAPYALAAHLAHAARRRSGRPVTTREVMSGAWGEICAEFTAAAATDGNHGRALAWAAARCGCKAVIYAPGAISPGRIAAIERFGARVVGGHVTYDEAVARCAADCRRWRWLEITDTAPAGERRGMASATARLVMAGYTIMADEALEASAEAPTHFFVQGGVGGFAAAMIARFWQRLGRPSTRVVVVEPDRAACLYASAAAGSPTPADGDLDTIIVGLACGEVSAPAWAIVAEGAFAFLRIADSHAIAAMRRLARPVAGDPPLIGGETGGAGLAGLLAVAGDPASRRALGLDRSSRVMVAITESATDPVRYVELTGLPI